MLGTVANRDSDIVNNAVINVAVQTLQQYLLVAFGCSLGALTLAKYKPYLLKEAAVVMAPTALYLLAKSTLGSPDCVVKHELAFEQNGVPFYNYHISCGSDPVDTLSIAAATIIGAVSSKL